MSLVQQAHAAGATGAINATAVAATTWSMHDWLSNFNDWVPAVAAAFSIVWFALEIWESETVIAWRQRRREKRNDTSGPTPR